MQTRSCPGKTTWEHAAVNFSNPPQGQVCQYPCPYNRVGLSPEVLSRQQQKHAKETEIPERKPTSGEAGSDTPKDLDRHPCPGSWI